MAPPTLRLVVDPNAGDQTLVSGLVGRSLPRRHSGFLAHGLDPATGHQGAFLHANVAAKVMLGAADVSDRYRLWRRLRSWSVSGTDVTTFGNLTKANDLDRDWFDDNQGGSGMADAPGVPLLENQTAFAMLYEFVVFIDGYFTEAPGAYFFVIFRLTETTYEVVRSDLVSITIEQWGPIEDTAIPWLAGRKIRTRTTKPLRRP